MLNIKEAVRLILSAFLFTYVSAPDIHRNKKAKKRKKKKDKKNKRTKEKQ